MVFDTNKPILPWFNLEQLVFLAFWNQCQSFLFVVWSTEIKVALFLPEGNLVVRLPFNNELLPALIGVYDNELIIVSLQSTSKTSLSTLKGHNGSVGRNKVCEVILDRQWCIDSIVGHVEACWRRRITLLDQLELPRFIKGGLISQLHFLTISA